MNFTKLFIFLTVAVIFAGCGTQTNQTANTNANTNVNATTNTNANANANTAQSLSEVPRPQKISDMMSARGEQDNAAPTLRFVEPRDGAVVNSSTVKVRLELGGDLRGYKTMMDPETKMGNHIHIILDNQPYEAYYNLDREFELRNVADGEHTLRVFPSRPWHESYKNDGAFQMIRFTVKNGGADTSKPATTNANQTMSNANTSATPEAKEMQTTTAGAIDPKRPLLTYSRPKGDYKGDEAQAIMIDFWLANARLTGDGGEYRVRYSVDGGEPKFIERWQPIWISGWNDGKRSLKLELIDKDGNVVDNGGYNSTTREITVAR